jgi:hypothetical protein
LAIQVSTCIRTNADGAFRGFGLVAQVLGQVGTRKHWAFCFGGARHSEQRRPDAAGTSEEASGINVEAADVQQERARVEGMTDYSDQSIVLSDLKKVYPPQGGKPAKVITATDAKVFSYLSTCQRFMSPLASLFPGRS